MPEIILIGQTIACLLLTIFTGNTFSNPIVDYERGGLKYEEYVVEHEISATQAKNAALTIDLDLIRSPAGCQRCTREEIRYCMGRDLISDHCCCDKRYHEVLPYIPHTCYIGTQICKPILGDCDEYSRLRTCCCDKHVLLKWKNKSSAVQLNTNQQLMIVVLVLMTQSFCKYLFSLD